MDLQISSLALLTIELSKFPHQPMLKYSSWNDRYQMPSLFFWKSKNYVYCYKGKFYIRTNLLLHAYVDSFLFSFSILRGNSEIQIIKKVSSCGSYGIIGEGNLELDGHLSSWICWSAGNWLQLRLFNN